MQMTPDQICFGLSREHDTQSFALFLQLLGKKEFAEVLACRLSSAEIDAFVTQCTSLMTRHLSEDEYHSLFLGHSESHSHSTCGSAT